MNTLITLKLHSTGSPALFSLFLPSLNASSAIKHLSNVVIPVPEIFIIFFKEKLINFRLLYSGCGEVSFLIFHNFTTYILYTNQSGQFLHLVFRSIFPVYHSLCPCLCFEIQCHSPGPNPNTTFSRFHPSHSTSCYL